MIKIENEEEFIKDYVNGMSIKDLSYIYGVSEPFTRRFLKERNVYVKKSRKCGIWDIPEEKIIRLLKKGYTKKIIGELYGYSNNTVKNYIREKHLEKYIQPKKTLSDLAREKGMKPITVYQRIHAYGYTLKDALNTPLLNERKRKKENER